MAGKAYNGRLAFDDVSGFHRAMVEGEINVPVQLDDGTWGNEVQKALVPGDAVVTDDEGKSWRYATKDDTPHNDRYQQAVAGVDSTANQLLELTMEHGREKAEQILKDEQPHHFEVQPDDPHFGGLRSDPDHVAEVVTSHTEAYS
jgi:hypothetical protein